MISIKAANSYCCEDISLIENYYDAINDNTKTWVCHHKNEIIMNKSVKELKELNLYYGQPAKDLIFLTSQEHRKLHSKNGTWNKGKIGVYSEETKYKMGSGNRGKLVWNSGKTGIYSDETLKKLSESHKGKKASEETKKKLSETRKGEGNGFYGHKHTQEAKEKNRIAHLGKKQSEETKEKRRKSMMGKNIGKKHSEDSKRKMGEYHKGTKWINKEGKTKQINHTEIEIYLLDGWKLGRK